MSRAKTIQEAEEKIPELAKSAIRAAYQEALDSGNIVLIGKDGEIRRIYPNGTTEFVKKIAPEIKIRKGTIIKIK